MTDDPADRLRRFTQQDWLASSIRTTLALTGPVGPILADFLTQFVPGQRIDRLHDYAERLGERLLGLEEEFRQRTHASAAYASLAEQASVAAVQSASAERRRDLAELLKTGLTKSDTELVEHHAFLALLGRLNVCPDLDPRPIRGFQERRRLRSGARGIPSCSSRFRRAAAGDGCGRRFTPAMDDVPALRRGTHLIGIASGH